MPEQDPIPPRRAARRHPPGEDDEVPPWANLPPVRPPRRAAAPRGAPPSGQPGGQPSGQHARRDPDAYRDAQFRDGPAGPRQDPFGSAGPAPDQFRDGPAGPGQDPFRDRPSRPSRPDQPARREQPPYPGQAPPRREPPSAYDPASPYDSGPRPAVGYLGDPSAPGPTRPGGAVPPDPRGGPDGGFYQPSGQFGGPPESQGGPGPGYVPDSAVLASEYDGEGEAAAFAPDDEAPSGPSGRSALGARARRALLRKRRRSLVMIGAAVVVIATVVSVVLLNQGGGQAANISSDFITSFQPGELRTVPNACGVIPAATVQQYLPGQVKQTAPQPINSNLGTGSACNWQLDHQPTYRLLEVNVLAYSPNGLPAGNGSATSAATDAYNQQYQALQAPSKDNVREQDTVTPLSGLGDAAFSAMQVFHVGGAISDTATVVIRYRNVIVQVELNGLDHSNKGHYGPVSQSELAAGAQAFAQAAYAALH